MKDKSGLIASLNGYLEWNKARVSCFLELLLGLFAVRTINLQEIALAMGTGAKVESRYRRLQRFFALFNLDYVKIARWIFTLYFRTDQKVYLLIDRTNWYWGKKKINIFLLSIAYEGMAIPLFWMLLPKAGSSNLKEQKALISQFIDTFGVDGVEGLLADREFASGKFFRWLSQQKISFYIRIKEGSMACIRTRKFLTAKKLFNHLSSKQQTVFQMSVWVFDEKVYLAASRSEKGELMIVATNKDPCTAIAKYLRRWEIESLFQSLKGRGFHFESTHITDLDRLAKVTAVLAIGFVWAHKVGEWKAAIKPIIWKQFRDQKRPQYSYFRYGLDCLREIVFKIYVKFSELKQCFKLILPREEVYL